MGESNQTYSTLPSVPGSGTGTPQLLSRVMARGCRPLSIQLLHCPYTLGFHSSFLPSTIHSFSQSSYLFSGKYQCFVLRFTGVALLSALRGSISCSGLKLLPHFSH